MKRKENCFLLKLLASKGKETPSNQHRWCWSDIPRLSFNHQFRMPIFMTCEPVKNYWASPWKITGRAREKLRHYYSTGLGFTIHGWARQFYYLKHYGPYFLPSNVSPKALVIFSVDIGLYPGYFGKDNRCDSVCSRNALTWKNFLSLQCHTESGGPSDGAQNFGQFLGLSGRRQKEEVPKIKDSIF